MLQDQGSFAVRVREQVWLLTCCCPFPSFHISSVKWAVLSFCPVSWKKNTTERREKDVWSVLNGSLKLCWWYLVLSGGWKAGSLIPRFMYQRTCSPSSGWGVWDMVWAEVLDFVLGPKVGSCFLTPACHSKICYSRSVGLVSLHGETKIAIPSC